MSEPAPEGRKLDHLRIVLGEDVSAKGVTTGLALYRFRHCALPDLNMSEIDTGSVFFGKPLRAPLLISSMTGGARAAEPVNLQLAEAAEAVGVAMGVGSQRAALAEDRLAYSYQVRRVAPTIPLLANIGAVQLNYGFGVAECQRAVDMIGADALILHLNPLQEAVQPEGNTNFKGLLNNIEEVCRRLEVPVVVKEVGNGISGAVARRLVDAGVAAIDVAGAGGTSWSEVERFRQTSERGRRVAGTFAGWGIPTAEALRQVRAELPNIFLIGSGGVRTGVDIAKCVALGADIAGAAAPMLEAQSAGGVEAIAEGLRALVDELRITMFCVGAADLPSLRAVPLERVL